MRADRIDGTNDDAGSTEIQAMLVDRLFET